LDLCATGQKLKNRKAPRPAAKTAAKAGHKQVRKPSPVAAGRKAKAR
jgi:hypothetical protein